MRNDVYPSLWYYPEQSRCLENPVLCLSTPSPLPLATADIFTVSIVLTFSECHLVGII